MISLKNVKSPKKYQPFTFKKTHPYTILPLPFDKLLDPLDLRQANNIHSFPLKKRWCVQISESFFDKTKVYLIIVPISIDHVSVSRVLFSKILRTLSVPLKINYLDITLSPLLC